VIRAGAVALCARRGPSGRKGGLGEGHELPIRRSRLGVQKILANPGPHTRSQGTKVTTVVSFPEGERPTRDQLADIEDRLSRRSVSRSTNGSRRCTRTPTTAHARCDQQGASEDIPECRAVPGSFSIAGGCAELEVKHGLIRDNHAPERGKANKASGQGRRLRGLSGLTLPFCNGTRECRTAC